MAAFEIRQIDALHLENEGWFWNASYKMGEFKTSATDEKRAFLYALHKMGIVCKRGKMKVIYDSDIFEVQDRRTGEPLYAAIPVA